MGTKIEGDMCYAAAMPDEPMFVLLARDLHAPQLVLEWAEERKAQIANGDKPEEDYAKVHEAEACAMRMIQWRKDNDGAWRNSAFKCGKPEPQPDDRPDLPKCVCSGKSCGRCAGRCQCTTCCHR